MKQKNDTFYIINKKKFTHDVSKGFVFEIIENINIKLIFTKASTDTLIPFYSPQNASSCYNPSNVIFCE